LQHTTQEQEEKNKRNAIQLENIKAAVKPKTISIKQEPQNHQQKSKIIIKAPKTPLARIQTKKTAARKE
jgi:hypothetical protein